MLAYVRTTHRGGRERDTDVEDAEDTIRIPLVANQANSTADGPNPPGPGSEIAVPANAAIDVRRGDLT